MAVTALSCGSKYVCVCVCMMRFVLAFVWECESVLQEWVCASGFEVCAWGREPAKYTMFSGWRASQKASRTTRIKSPFHQSLHLYLSIPALLRQTNPFLSSKSSFSKMLFTVFPFFLESLQLSVMAKTEEKECRNL